MTEPHSESAPDHTLERIAVITDRWLKRLEAISLGLAAIALFAIMTLVFLDGTLRYLINRPLKFATDVVVLYLISAAFLLVLSDTLRRGGHINVDFFTALMRPRTRRLLSGIAFLASAVIVGIMSFEMVDQAWESFKKGEVLIGLYAMPLWLSKAIVAFSLVLLNLRLIHLGFFDVAYAITGRKGLEIQIEAFSEHPEEEPT